MLKIIKYIGIAFFCLLCVASLAAFISSRMALDTQFSHTESTINLPKLSSNTADGLVTVDIGSTSFRARIAGFDGNDAKPLVILLHGFPVTSAMWIELLPLLAERGFRALAIDQRGYSPGARPGSVEGYRTMKMVEDVFSLADVIGAQDFHLVGHDWGSAIGWYSVMKQPNRILSFTGLSVPHPHAFFSSVQNDPNQKSKSWYFTLFNLPLVPEIVLSMNDFRALKIEYEVMNSTKEHDFLTVLREPGALTAALNWYRAAGKMENMLENHT